MSPVSSTRARVAAPRAEHIEVAHDPNAMRCLSVRDPWIKLLGDGRKPYELRRKVTHYRGRVVLCSSSQPSRTDDARAARLRYVKRGHLWTSLPMGRALFVGTLADCRPATLADESGAGCKPLVGEEFVWHFTDVTPLPEPFPVKGWLGLYHPPPDLRRYLKEARVL